MGADTFDYIVRDGEGLSSNVATATITVEERAFPYQNPLNRLDTDGDGFIVPRDALLIINEINSRAHSDRETGQIVSPLEPGTRPASNFDVTGDGYVVARDVLFVVNFINESLGREAMVEPREPGMPGDLAAAAVFAMGNWEIGDSDDDESAV